MKLFPNTSFIFETLLRGIQELFAILQLIYPISLSLPSVESEFKEKQKAFFEESQFEEYEDEYAAICFLDGKFNFLDTMILMTVKIFDTLAPLSRICSMKKRRRNRLHRHIYPLIQQEKTKQRWSDWPCRIHLFSVEMRENLQREQRLWSL